MKSNDWLHVSNAVANKRGSLPFTLVELLVVIAIIAILAGMLLPSLNKARERAKTAKCISNQKQYSLSCIQYGSDYSGWLPISRMEGVSYEKPPFGADEATTAARLLYSYKYLSQGEVFFCEGVLRALGQDPGTVKSSRGDFTWSSYGLLEWGNAALNKSRFTEPFKTAGETLIRGVQGKICKSGEDRWAWQNFKTATASPSTRILGGDVAAYSGGVFTARQMTSWLWNLTDSTARGLLIFVHGGMGNAFYQDGHASTIGVKGLNQSAITHALDGRVPGKLITGL